MSGGIFAIAFVGGAGLVAVWITARFPNLAQSRLRVVLLHMLAAFLLAQLVPHAIELSGPRPAGLYVSLFLIAFPVLVYTFLVALWLIRVAQGAIGGMLR